MSRHSVVLVPGFFGFENVGGLSYFVGVGEVLQKAFEAQGHELDVIQLQTLPTGSIRQRAGLVLEKLAELEDKADHIHLIGHSTGGLDARLAVAPTASLATDTKFNAYERVSSLVTVATPHHGTPLATTLGGALGGPLLRFLALASAVVLEHGSLPLSAGIKLGYVVTRLDDYVGLKGTALDKLYDQVLNDFSPERRARLVDFVARVSRDQQLIFQLTSAGCDLINACTADPTDIRYGSVITRACPPSFKGVLSHRHNLYAQTLYAIYSAAHTLTARGRDQTTAPLTSEHERKLRQAYGELPDARSNDGVVPTLSQVWGPIIACLDADHLDVVGHFGRPQKKAPDADWLPSNSGFNQARFHECWDKIAKFMLESVS